jgi:hypothetical protein
MKMKEESAKAPAAAPRVLKIGTSKGKGVPATDRDTIRAFLKTEMGVRAKDVGYNLEFTLKVAGKRVKHEIKFLKAGSFKSSSIAGYDMKAWLRFLKKLNAATDNTPAPAKAVPAVNAFTKEWSKVTAVRWAKLITILNKVLTPLDAVGTPKGKNGLNILGKTIKVDGTTVGGSLDASLEDVVEPAIKKAGLNSEITYTKSSRGPGPAPAVKKGPSTDTIGMRNLTTKLQGLGFHPWASAPEGTFIKQVALFGEKELAKFKVFLTKQGFTEKNKRIWTSPDLSVKFWVSETTFFVTVTQKGGKSAKVVDERTTPIGHEPKVKKVLGPGRPSRPPGRTRPSSTANKFEYQIQGQTFKSKVVKDQPGDRHTSPIWSLVFYNKKGSYTFPEEFSYTTGYSQGTNRSGPEWFLRSRQFGGVGNGNGSSTPGSPLHSYKASQWIGDLASWLDMGGYVYGDSPAKRVRVEGDVPPLPTKERRTVVAPEVPAAAAPVVKTSKTPFCTEADLAAWAKTMGLKGALKVSTHNSATAVDTVNLTLTRGQAEVVRSFVVDKLKAPITAGRGSSDPGMTKAVWSMYQWTDPNLGLLGFSYDYPKKVGRVLAYNVPGKHEDKPKQSITKPIVDAADFLEDIMEAYDIQDSEQEGSDFRVDFGDDTSIWLRGGREVEGILAPGKKPKMDKIIQKLGLKNSIEYLGTKPPRSVAPKATVQPTATYGLDKIIANLDGIRVLNGSGGIYSSGKGTFETSYLFESVLKRAGMSEFTSKPGQKRGQPYVYTSKLSGDVFATWNAGTESCTISANKYLA